MGSFRNLVKDRTKTIEGDDSSIDFIDTFLRRPYFDFDLFNYQECFIEVIYNLPDESDKFNNQLTELVNLLKEAILTIDPEANFDLKANIHFDEAIHDGASSFQYHANDIFECASILTKWKELILQKKLFDL